MCIVRWHGFKNASCLCCWSWGRPLTVLTSTSRSTSSSARLHCLFDLCILAGWTRSHECQTVTASHGTPSDPSLFSKWRLKTSRAPPGKSKAALPGRSVFSRFRGLVGFTWGHGDRRAKDEKKEPGREVRSLGHAGSPIFGSMT